MKHSMSTSVCDDSGGAALSPASWGPGGLHITFLCLSFLFRQPPPYGLHLVLSSFGKPQSTGGKPVYYSFFPSSSMYPIANYKAKRDVFTPVKAAISQRLSYQSKDETTHNQPTEENLQGGWVGKWLPHSRPHGHPKGHGAQPALTPQLILPFSEASGVLAPSY